MGLHACHDGTVGTRLPRPPVWYRAPCTGQWGEGVPPPYVYWCAVRQGLALLARSSLATVYTRMHTSAIRLPLLATP
jgi:hypothetical protein